MKQTVLYNCFIVFNKNGMVVTTYDGWPAGIDGRCNHVTSTLFAMEEFFKQSKAPVNPFLMPALSCTSKPCTWNAPRKRRIDNLSIAQVKLDHVYFVHPLTDISVVIWVESTLDQYIGRHTGRVLTDMLANILVDMSI